MRARISEAWIAEMTEKMRAYQSHLCVDGSKPKAIEVTTSFNQAIQWLIIALDKFGIPFRVISLGAGVKKVTTDVQVCPKCHGTGKC